MLALTLLLLAAIAQELYGRSLRSVAVLLLVGSVGLWDRAHQMSPELGLLLGVAIALYGFALALRKPVVGGAIIGTGIAIAFLSRGFLGPLWLALTAVVLPIGFREWRSRGYAQAVGIAVVVAVVLGGSWPLALALRGSTYLDAWWAAESLGDYFAPISPEASADPLYVLKNLPWYAWPALPLVLWTFWTRGRGFKGGLRSAAIALPTVLAAVIFLMLLVMSEARASNWMPLLLPLCLLATAEVDTLPRGFSGALDWFGILTFGLAAILVWGIWIDSYVNGMSLATARFFRDTEIGFQPTFKLWAMCAAVGMTVFWVAMVRPARRSNRRAVLNWAVGVTLLWALVSTIWLPYIDSRRSYRVVAESIRTVLPADGCVASRNLGDAQRALLAYFADLRTEREESGRGANCALLLVQFGRADVEAPSSDGMRPVWEGQRRGDATEKFVLYRRGPK
jgi:4-amino-4-deoxy-L-arabinose transferase-like glycosyltransferase